MRTKKGRGSSVRSTKCLVFFVLLLPKNCKRVRRRNKKRSHTGFRYVNICLPPLPRQRSVYVCSLLPSPNVNDDDAVRENGNIWFNCMCRKAAAEGGQIFPVPSRPGSRCYCISSLLPLSLPLRRLLSPIERRPAESARSNIRLIAVIDLLGALDHFTKRCKRQKPLLVTSY